MRLTAIVLSAFALCSCSLRLPVEPYTPRNTPHSKNAESVEVWLHSDGYHTGLVFPYPWLVDAGYVSPEGLGKPRAVVVSWGNTNAYSDEGIGNLHQWFRVICTSTPAVMELIGINRPVTSVKPNQNLWKANFPASRGPYLAHFLNQCTKYGEDGKPIVVRASSWGKGLQVESRHKYFIPRVCNIWSAQAIETLGGTIDAWRATTARGLTKQLNQNGFSLVHKGL
ncbi:MAG: DUF2459 domain-containing protein [Luteolibacter sp.]